MSKSYLCGNSLSFHCPGCKRGHGVPVDGSRGWVWNQNLEKPTLSPSILVTYPANPNAAEEFKEWRTKRICHSFVTDGRIQFLSDCTHELAGQTVDLPDWDD
ncbi:hypothetical protein MTYP_01060 [Methylophilaceae bacterium]|nr:hypothetical protein MTYP_01060 [Methylophilaceae bacterium]